MSMLGRVLLLATVIVAVAGCGGDATGVKTVGVSGTVYLDDQPLPDVRVVFMSANHAGNGRTDANGKYYLVAGAEPGTNKISFSKVDDPTLNPEAGLDQGQLEAAALGSNQKAEIKQRIPAEYASPETTTLTFDVPAAGTKTADFRLQSKK
jgi:hypothetical protein